MAACPCVWTQVAEGDHRLSGASPPLPRLLRDLSQAVAPVCWHWLSVLNSCDRCQHACEGDMARTASSLLRSGRSC